MIPDPQTPIVIDAITLRGIGSYLHGARLEIKPLTILCGANGSGKSTWLKALNILADALSSNRFPFGFKDEDYDSQNIQITNAFYHLADPDEFESLENPATTEEFGTPGTIGLELHALESYEIPETNTIKDDAKGSAWKFLNKGHEAKSQFRLRIAHPTYKSDNTSTPILRHVVELQLNGKHILRMEKERDPLQKFEAEKSQPWRGHRPYALSCSRSFLSGSDDDDDLVAVATVVFDQSVRFEDLAEGVNVEQASTLFESFCERQRYLLKQALDGYFYIGAIRQPNKSLSLDDNQQSGKDVSQKKRYVGAAGEHAWQLEIAHADRLMRRIRTPCFTAAEINQFSLLSSILEYYTDIDMNRWGDEILGSLLERVSPEKCDLLKQASYKLRDYFNLSADLKNVCPEELLIASEIESKQQEASTWLVSCDVLKSSDFFLEILNDLVNEPELYVNHLWQQQESDEHDNDEIEFWEFCDSTSMTIENDPELRLLAWMHKELSPEEIRLLNYLLIRKVFGRDAFAPSNQHCSFDQYLSFWLKHLVNTDLRPPVKTGTWNQKEPWWDLKMEDCPTPYLTQKHYPSDDNKKSLARLNHPCFGSQVDSLQPPRQSSAGFHQILPIFVQLGLMKSGELIGIENPEVHLHPSLQVQITKALIDHAQSGRRIIVETHSDLVLRRVMRAILEEDIPQSQVHICFAALDQSQKTKVGGDTPEFFSSSLEPIQIDEQGRIANWPAGFLDDDVRESQRLMDVMYGKQEDDDDDDDAS